MDKDVMKKASKAYDKNFENTEPLDREASEKAIFDFYDTFELERPEVHFLDGPNCYPPGLLFAGIRIEDVEIKDLREHNPVMSLVTRRGIGKSCRMHHMLKKILSNMICDHRSKAVFIPQDYEYRSSFNEKEDEYSKWYKLTAKIADNSYGIITTKGHVYVMDRPNFVKTNENGYHNKDGPAIIFNSGKEIYALEGIIFDQKFFKNPEEVTLEEIHSHRNNTHLAINLIGVDRYLDLCEDFKIDTSNAFAKLRERYFNNEEMPSFGEKKKTRLEMYGKDNPIIVTFTKGTVNDKWGTLIKSNAAGLFHFSSFDDEESKLLFNDEDKELWDFLGIDFNTELGYDGQFFVRQKDSYHKTYHDAVPHWFKAKMYRKETCYFKSDAVTLTYECGQLHVEIDDKFTKHESLWGSTKECYYEADFDLRADSWEELMEKWVEFIFDCNYMHGDSRTLQV
jgi:hypothetical protein